MTDWVDVIDVTEIHQRMQFMDEMEELRVHANQVLRYASDLKSLDVPDLEEEAAAAVGVDELAEAIFDLEHACNDGDTLADTQLAEWREELDDWAATHVS